MVYYMASDGLKVYTVGLMLRQYSYHSNNVDNLLCFDRFYDDNLQILLSHKFTLFMVM